MTGSMAPVRMRPGAPTGAMKRQLVAAILAIVALSLGTVGGVAARGPAAVDPGDPRLTPNPVEFSDEGTLWTCRATGSDIACSGTLSIAWELQGGPDFCAVPLLSLDGTFSRTQTRFYAVDAASGLYLEYKRLIHLDSIEDFTPAPDPSSTNVVNARLSMTWISTFQSPGDLDSRSTRKQGIDTFIKTPHGGVIVLDIGQKTEDLTIAPGEDFDFRGRWDIALGDPGVEFGKICAALGL
jgi:hypothetical protein